MRKTLLIASIALLSFNSISQAQTILRWTSDFSPSWSDGTTNATARNINGTSVSCRVNTAINGAGSFQLAMGNSGSLTPTVFGATFTVPGSSSSLQVTPNYGNNTSNTDIELAFTSIVSNVNFLIADIDKDLPISTSYFDRVTITGTDGITVYTPTVTRYDETTDANFLVINGNSAQVNTTPGVAGNARSDNSDQRGTISISFGSAAISKINIIYDNASGADADPASQSIAIGNISFTNATLPVKLSNFSGRRIGQEVNLNWTVQQEINMSGYSIERNTGNSWETIGFVPSRGNGNGESLYTYLDRNLAGTNLLYRLKMINSDNNYKYSGIVRIGSNDAAVTLLTYPNPVINDISININSPVAQAVLSTLYDATGKALLSETRRLNAGNNNFSMTNLASLSSGIYYIEIKDESGTSIGRSKIVKQ